MSSAILSTRFIDLSATLILEAVKLVSSLFIQGGIQFQHLHPQKNFQGLSTLNISTIKSLKLTHP